MPASRKTLIAAAVALAVAVLAWFTLRPEPAPDAAPPVSATPGVIAFAPNAPELDSIRLAKAVQVPLPLSGDLNARLAVDEDATGRVASPVAGRVTRILRDLGDSVARGDALAILDAPDLGAAQADLARAQADARLKAEALRRARDLYQGQAIARRELEAAEADAAEASAERQRAALRVGNLGSGSAGENLTLRAPVAGIVIARTANPGEQVQPGGDALFVVSDPKRLWLLIDLPESDIARARLNESVDFTVDAWPGRRFTGRIARVSPAVDPVTRRVQVRVAVANPDLALKPEMFARARIAANDGRTGLQVPNTALIEDGVRNFVLVAETPSRFRRVPVTVASRGTSNSYITGGIAPGTTVVGDGALLLNAQIGN
ncbi:efflux RND transporter periplasmic adaptor subunit [Sandaracinobacteroides saxicola]|uniref:Efflux RND transporter periplasmic adaptor subunit n=1 Tax=Sandaracinobacteroides saxicola TaxID=2759707 RepID=A0A7G5IIW0_9SPHN|nr:efflux RND transporter periplasmic adaptor subunit [Sandaracinobacteroides saxicola]QMW23302.1 efflux RND transporter periplasmic adaptor subunit [Sandaracinobacteroides saxicola]